MEDRGPRKKIVRHHPHYNKSLSQPSQSLIDKNIDNTHTLFVYTHTLKLLKKLFSTDKCNEFTCFFNSKDNLFDLISKQINSTLK